MFVERVSRISQFNIIIELILPPEIFQTCLCFDQRTEYNKP